MKESSYSKIANKVSPLIRRYLDLAIKKSGSFVSVLRLSVPASTKPDVYGRMPNPTISSGEISNAVISYPLNEIEMFDNVKNKNLNVNSISLMDILPITLYTAFETSSGDVTETIDLENGDYIIHVLKDHRGNKLPIRLQVEKMTGSFYDRNLVNMWYELSLVRGKLRSDIETTIQNYVDLVD